jgi:hypothetical protein
MRAGARGGSQQQRLAGDGEHSELAPYAPADLPRRPRTLNLCYKVQIGNSITVVVYGLRTVTD